MQLVPSRSLTHSIWPTTSKTSSQDSFAMLNISRARLEYDITQQPAFVGQIGSSNLSLLREAAASHRVALDIEQDNADVLLSVPSTSHVNNYAHT